MEPPCWSISESLTARAHSVGTGPFLKEMWEARAETEDRRNEKRRENFYLRRRYVEAA